MVENQYWRGDVVESGFDPTRQHHPVGPGSKKQGFLIKKQKRGWDGNFTQNYESTLLQEGGRAMYVAVCGAAALEVDVLW